jgi:hypothetical protein
MNGSYKNLRCRVNVAGEFIFFTISGEKNTKIKNPKEGQSGKQVQEQSEIQNEKQSEKQEGNSTREEGYFSFEIKVPTSQVILADHKVKNIDKNYGLLSLEFDLLEENS